MATYPGRGVPSNGSVYVYNLPPGTSESMLAEYFGTIGLLKKDKRTGQPKIWIYRDKATNEPKGDATVTYEDPHAAFAAVEWFHNKDFHGSVIGVQIAESKNKDSSDHPYNHASDPTGDFAGQEDDRDLSGGAGTGRGRGDGKSWQQDGDWLCPNTSCGNVNFAFRGVCNRCGTARPAGSGGAGSVGGGRGRGRGSSDPESADLDWDWLIPGRGGRGGGYKELDEEEIEETRRRRREAEEDDGEMYDEFGNLKKKFRAKMQQIDNGSTLPGSGRAGWEVELGRDSKERGKERVRDHSSRESSKSRDRDGHSHERERRRSRSRERDRDYEKERSRDKDRDRDRERVQDYERGREYRRDRDRHQDW
ncbi:hypothetical protein Taro_052015 [Colocasia esculenta]|uniref:Transcription initiation factor TFIID subunit 15 n=1 Tax=Colocasia esculenta TaxID=4460 RepID=A0A843XIQ9_COLES|nr:hypothetical protein [Colocasia esculenta]